MKANHTYWICLAPVLLSALYWFDRPFQQGLGEAHSSIRHLSGKSKINIQRACRSIDGYVVKPGDTFSFNQVVGPRTHERGYVSAPTYLGNGTESTEGGGVCLVSSLVYKAALESGLTIVERTAHSRTISTVPPGLDATVWYGRYDLKVKNDSKEPIQLNCEFDPADVAVKLEGPRNSAPVKLVRRETSTSTDQVAVTVYLQKNGLQETVSKDLYDRTAIRAR